MARSTPAAALPVRPIAVLRQHVTELEAAITVTLASPKKEAVHRIRTSTRRIEAQIALLALLPGVPDHARRSEKALRELGKLRREAGKVRDLDVQRRLLQAAPEQPSSSDDFAPERVFARQAKALRQTLKHRRNERAERLQHWLERQSRSISRKLEKLLAKLEPAEATEISPRELAELTREWFRTNLPDTDDITSVEGLHSVRKAAKLARYIAESTAATGAQRGESRSAKSGAGDLATQFEALQQSGGDWHDLLTLSAIARHELGKRDPLTRELARRCEEALAAYQEQLRHPPV